MNEKTLVQAINDGLRVALKNNPDVLIMGEDVGKNGGVFRATEGLWEAFGDDRVIDTPLAEAGIVGTATWDGSQWIASCCRDSVYGLYLSRL